MPYIRRRILQSWANCRAFARHMTETYGPGWDEGMISRLNCGLCWPTRERLDLLCKELDCRPADLYTAEELQNMAELALHGLADLAARKENDHEDEQT